MIRDLANERMYEYGREREGGRVVEAINYLTMIYYAKRGFNRRTRKRRDGLVITRKMRMIVPIPRRNDMNCALCSRDKHDEYTIKSPNRELEVGIPRPLTAADG